MLKLLVAAIAALVLTCTLLTDTVFAQDKPAAKPAVFIASHAPSSSANSSAQGTVTLSDADTQTISQLLSECPGIQAAAKELEADYTLRMSNQDGSKNQLQVLNAAGVIVASGLAGDTKSAVKDACSIVLSDFNNNGKAALPVLDPESQMVPVPSLAAESTPVTPTKPAQASEPTPASFVTVSATPAQVPAPEPLVTPASQPAAPKAAAAPQAPPVVPGAGTIHGTTVSAPDANAPYQAAQPQQQESLGEIARRNRAAKAAHQQQQAQNQAPSEEAPH